MTEPLNLQRNIILAPYTTFRIGGPAKYFFVAKNKRLLIEAIRWARDKEVPFFILGGGSNLLVSDNGFRGLVIKIKNQKLKVKSPDIYVGAGVPLAKLVTESVRASLTGLEWATGIPGTVGGAICGNAGAFGHSISESVENVEVLDLRRNNVTIKSRHSVVDPRKIKKSKIFNFSGQFSNVKCRFGYRESIFKHQPLIILSAVFRLRRGNKEESQKVIRQYLKERREKIPIQPSAGSIFKNIVIDNSELKLKKKIPAEKVKGGKIAAGYLIERCGLMGRQIGQAKISKEHANFIVNLGGARAKDVIELIKLCKKEVKNKFGLVLEEEIRYL